MEILQKIWESFRGGRYTRTNVAKVSDDHVLVGKDVIFPGDGVIHKRPGYTLVATLVDPAHPAANYVPKRFFDFKRQSDGQQYVLMSGFSEDFDALVVWSSNTLAWMRNDGTGLTILVRSEPGQNVWDFATSVHSAYMCNGAGSGWALLDVAGTPTLKEWGLPAPGAAPSIATGAGTLSLTYGRQYAYSWVRKWTDSQGTVRLHVGPPSQLSAHTGPLANKVVTVGAIAAADIPQLGGHAAQATHVWVWATNDTPFNSTSVLFFAAEITVGTTSWGDTLPDSSLDVTRQAPYQNLPPPKGSILIEFEGCIAIGGIAGKPDLVVLTGQDEILLGIPQETAPIFKFFNVPGGIKAVVGGITFNTQLMVATADGWWPIGGNNSSTFSEGDMVIAPGLGAQRARCQFGGWMIWLGPDRKLWAWNGAGEPIELSWKIALSEQVGSLSMESLSAAALATAELRVVSFGRYNVLVLCASTNGTYLDWFSLWDVSALAGPAGPMGLTTDDGRLQISAESDMIPSHPIGASAIVQVGNQPYLFMATGGGQVYRWPDGFTDAGTTFAPLVGGEISDLDEPDVNKRMRWLDVLTSRADAQTAFTLLAIAMDGVNLNVSGLPVPQRNMPNTAQGGTDQTTVRGMLEQTKGTAYGKNLRWWIQFPADALDAKVFKVVAKFTPLNQR